MGNRRRSVEDQDQGVVRETGRVANVTVLSNRRHVSTLGIIA